MTPGCNNFLFSFSNFLVQNIYNHSKRKCNRRFAVYVLELKLLGVPMWKQTTNWPEGQIHCESLTSSTCNFVPVFICFTFCCIFWQRNSRIRALLMTVITSAEQLGIRVGSVKSWRPPAQQKILKKCWQNCPSTSSCVVS